jgi:metacaspase-1
VRPPVVAPPKPKPKPTPVPAKPAVVVAPPPAPVVVAPPPPPPIPTGLVRSLLIGINYNRSSYQLAGCINDVLNMKRNLETFYPMCKEYRLITDDTTEKPTKENILRAIDWLVAGLQPGQNVYFHFSGHGGRVRDTNGDEITGLDSCLYPFRDGRLETLTDDELRAALAMRIPAGCKCFVVLDCCHSGTAVDLRCDWQANSRETIVYKENPAYPKTPGNVLFLSGCQDVQLAADTVDKSGRPVGAMTMALLATWAAYGPAIKTKYLLWDVRQFLRDNGYAQIPQLSTGYFIDINSVFDLGAA